MSAASAGHSAGEVEVSLAQILFPVDGGADIEARRAEAAGLRDRLGDCAAMSEAAADWVPPTRVSSAGCPWPTCRPRFAGGGDPAGRVR